MCGAHHIHHCFRHLFVSSHSIPPFSIHNFIFALQVFFSTWIPSHAFSVSAKMNGVIKLESGIVLSSQLVRPFINISVDKSSPTLWIYRSRSLITCDYHSARHQCIPTRVLVAAKSVCDVSKLWALIDRCHSQTSISTFIHELGASGEFIRCRGNNGKKWEEIFTCCIKAATIVIHFVAIIRAQREGEGSGEKMLRYVTMNATRTM